MTGVASDEKRLPSHERRFAFIVSVLAICVFCHAPIIMMALHDRSWGMLAMILVGAPIASGIAAVCVFAAGTLAYVPMGKRVGVTLGAPLAALAITELIMFAIPSKGGC